MCRYRDIPQRQYAEREKNTLIIKSVHAYPKGDPTYTCPVMGEVLSTRIWGVPLAGTFRPHLDPRVYRVINHVREEL